jgi:DNA replication protein DnaC
MMVNGSVVCPRCNLEKDTKKLERETTEYFNRLEQEKKYNTLFDQSIIEDQTLLNARLKNYKTSIEEETRNKAIIVNCLHRYNNGDKFNIVLQGNPGTGKSHLAYSILFELNETRQYSCLFIAVEAMLRKIKNSFNDKGSKYTEEYFNRLLSDVDFLVLDDLGAETGAIKTDKQATDFVQRILYGVANTRQSKATILTTNLDGKTLYTMYDQKLVSRLFKNREFVIFKESKDKRVSNFPF